MKDEHYVFLTDCADKKRVARGALNRRCGSKSKKCTLPHENMSKKEIKAMNSIAKSYNLNAWIDWNEFKEFPDDLKIEYINRIIQHYKVGLSSISDVLFKKSSTNLRMYLSHAGILDKIITTNESKNRINRFNFASAVANSPTVIPKDEPEKVEPPVQVDDIPEEVKENTQNDIDEIQENIPEEHHDEENFESSSVVDAKFVLDSFDMKTLEYISKMFEGRKVTVAISIRSTFDPVD